MAQVDLKDHALLSRLPPSLIPSQSRLSFLYSSLAPRREANPTGYNSALAWWASVVPALVTEGAFGDDKLLLTAEGGEAWREKWRVDGVGAPLGLGTVIKDLTKDGVLVPMSTFEHPPPAPTLLTTLLSYIPSPFASSASIQDPPLPTSRTVYVVSALLKSAIATVSRILEKRHAGGTLIDRLYTYDSLKAFITDKYLETSLSMDDVKVLVKQLERNGTCIVKNSVIKFPIERLDSALLTNDDSITETDLSLLTLSLSLQSLTTSIASLTSQITSLHSSVLLHLKANNKSLASKELARRKRLEKVVEERESKREILENLLKGIEDAVDNTSMMATIKSATHTLKTLTSSPALDVQNVEQTMDDMHEALDDAKLVQDAVDTGGIQGADDTELEDELAELMLEDAASKKEAEVAPGNLAARERESQAAKNRKEPVSQKREDAVGAKAGSIDAAVAGRSQDVGTAQTKAEERVAEAA